jgi:uncharacterized protein YqeY
MMDDAAETLRIQLRADLKLAMQARNGVATRVLRLLVAAIDNAQAVPVDPDDRSGGLNRFGDGAVEVARTSLSEADVQALLMGEIDARETAAETFRGLGRGEQADLLYAEAEIVRRYLG